LQEPTWTQTANCSLCRESCLTFRHLSAKPIAFDKPFNAIMISRHRNQELLFCATADMIDECITPCALLKYKLYPCAFQDGTWRTRYDWTVSPPVMVKGVWMVPSYL
jgi:hypothetical protein